MATRRREEVLNVLSAQCICDTGLTADPENILNVQGNRKMPDVLVYFQGLRCSIDGKYDDNPSWRDELENQVSKRLSDGLAHVGVGVLTGTDGPHSADLTEFHVPSHLGRRWIRVHLFSAMNGPLRIYCLWALLGLLALAVLRRRGPGLA